MLIVISPAKSLDFETKPKTKKFTEPEFLDDSHQLVKELRKLTPPDFSNLMGISQKLADLNFGRYLNWQLSFTPNNAKQAVLTFTGDVYIGLNASSFTAKDFTFAQKHLRILSGLYGLLRPLDLIQPYRLEMGTKFNNSRGKDLYEFWDTKITEAVGTALKKQYDDVLINLASNEYFKSIKPELLDARIISPVFKDLKNGQYKIISFFAKKARGMMSAFIIKNQIKDIKGLKKFKTDGYYFSKEESSRDELVFLRDEPV